MTRTDRAVQTLSHSTPVTVGLMVTLAGGLIALGMLIQTVRGHDLALAEAKANRQDHEIRLRMLEATNVRVVALLERWSLPDPLRSHQP